MYVEISDVQGFSKGLVELTLGDIPLENALDVVAQLAKLREIESENSEITLRKFLGMI